MIISSPTISSTSKLRPIRSSFNTAAQDSFVRSEKPAALPPEEIIALPSDGLSALIAAGDIAGVRRHFDEVFWTASQDRPGWRHLKIAVQREDRPMLRLLSAWGATAGESELAAFKTETGAKYPLYRQFMRAAGLRLPEAPASESPVSQTPVSESGAGRSVPPRPEPVRAVPRYGYDPEPGGGGSNYSYGSGGSNYSGGGYGGSC